MQKLLYLLLICGQILSFAAASISADSRADIDRQDPTSPLLEIGHQSKVVHHAAGSEIKIVSYNIRWRSGAQLRKLAQLMKEDHEVGRAAIFGLQEVDRNKRRSGRENTIKFLARELGMHYAWAAPPSTSSNAEEETGVAILSSYPLTDVRRIVLPHDGPGGRRRAALGATLSVGDMKLRFYSVHSETRISITRKLEQMKAVLDDLNSFPKTLPAVVVGDLNTWELPAVSKTVELFQARGFHTPFDDQPTFSRRFLSIGLELRLDWIWLRNLEVAQHGIDREIDLSDHWPLWLIVKSKSSKNGKR